MRNFLLAGILLALTINCSAQSKADYEQAIKKIGKYYNKKQTDSLLHMYSAGAKEPDISIWTGKEIDERKIRYGRMISYDYVGEHNGLALFKTEFTRSTHIVGLQLDGDHKLLVFQFKVNSQYADSLLEGHGE